MRRQQLTPEERNAIVKAYTVDLIPMITLAEKYGRTRQGIYKVLVKAGVNTSKENAGRMPVPCTVCGKVTFKPRHRVRRTKHLFCNQKCYFAWLEHGNGNPLIIHRHSARLARAKVLEYFDLEPEHIVHHEDRNQYNNLIANLKVFANNGDHVRYHRGFTVPILWQGK